ncbi:MAG TPA: CBS domain-containing protein [Thermoplasmata archaeon]|nr:CBS domain-containing protein [Thermoplasmata archaeon]
MWAADVMTRDLVTLTPDMTLEVAAERLVQRAISGAPVVDARGRLLGILSESDILRHLKQLAEETLGKRYLTSQVHALDLLAFLGEREHVAVEEVYRRLRASKVSEVMTKHVVAMKPTDTLESVAAAMIEHDVNRLPVVDAGRVVGIITRADLARVLATGRADIPRL